MNEGQETSDAEDTTRSRSTTLSPPRPPGLSERLSCPKNSVCSRSYFVLVMVFFHVYIINVIALLFYVHYSSSSGGQDNGSQSRDAPSGHHQQRPESAQKPQLLRDVPLARIEGIRVSTTVCFITMTTYNLFTPPHSRSHSLWFVFQVGHVQRVALVPGKVHEMRTLSLKPLLFGERRVDNIEKKTVKS